MQKKKRNGISSYKKYPKNYVNIQCIIIFKNYCTITLQELLCNNGNKGHFTLVRTDACTVITNTKRGYFIMNMFCFQCQETAKGTGCTIRGVCGKTGDVSRLQDLLSMC